MEIGRMRGDEHESVARLLHRSLSEWYESRLQQGSRFGDSHAPFLLFPRVYEALDPGECVVARDAVTGGLLGVCFSHERETHVGVGIVATAPEAGGRGVARAMMEVVLANASALGKPARLVSSLMNLDSFSLYTRLGFVPGAIYQDMILRVPDYGMPQPAPSGADAVSGAQANEAERIADFEHAMCGIRRQKDYDFFLRNEVGAWRVLVANRHDGALGGFLVASVHPDFPMIGPGVASDETTAAALLWSALDGLRGRDMVFLVPCAAANLVRTAYSWGARNIELHVSQSTAPFASSHGVVFPTFLPESG